MVSGNLGGFRWAVTDSVVKLAAIGDTAAFDVGLRFLVFHRPKAAFIRVLLGRLRVAGTTAFHQLE